MTGSAAGRVLLGGQDVGSGFAITEGQVLTAGHVVRNAATVAGSRPGQPVAQPGPVLEWVVDGGEPAAVPAVVAYQPDDSDPIPVTRVEVDTGLDVAVLHLQRLAPAVLPVAGPVVAGAKWRVETRPKANDAALTGTVTHPHRRMRNEAGNETTLIQLGVEQDLGGFRGYAGSPVIAAAAGGDGGGVLGVLVEQARWRVSPQIGQPPPVANVLFAASIGRVLSRFDLAGALTARSVTPIPLPTPFEVNRPRQLEQVISALLTELTGPSPGGQVVALAGMGGSGKSVLAAAAARDARMESAFPDGRFWLELGPDPPLLQLQASLAAALGDTRPITDVPQGRARLSSLLAEHKYLLVLDNVWDQADVPALAVAGPPCRVLVTTRDASAVPGATVIPVGELDPEQAVLMLAGWAPPTAGQVPEEAQQVARGCGYLPLALAVCGALINAGSHDWRQLLGLLREGDLDALPIPLEGYPHRNLAVALAASIDTLPPAARDRYLELAVFSGQGPVPVYALQALWGLGQRPATAVIGDLAGKSLLRAEAGRVSLHDLQMDYLSRRAPDLPALHNQLLAAYGRQCPSGWASGPDDGYFYQHLAHHLREAGRTQELQELLLDLDWITTKLATGTIPELLADYDILRADPALRVVSGALRLSAHVLADDPGQLPSQLTGRLADHTDPRLQGLLQCLRQWPAPWAAPADRQPHPPGGSLQRTLTGHHGEVHTVAVSADGRCAVSGGRDGTVRVWDLDAGKLRHTLTGHDGEVRAVVVSFDGRRAVSGGSDGTVRVWDLDAGKLRHTLIGPNAWVMGVAVSADGGRAVSGGDDKTVRVWDLDAATLLHTLEGHDGGVWAVAVSADGRRAVSGGDDGTVRVWDLQAGTSLHTLTGHDRRVRAVAVNADGSRAVSGGDDKTVRVWDLDSRTLLHTLRSHDGEVHAVAVSADRWGAISGGTDRTVRVWDLDSGTLLHTLEGHDGGVWAVAISTDGRRAVSGGHDGTVRVWDLEAVGEPRDTLEGRDPLVWAVAVSADGRRAVGGCFGGAVRVWDLHAGTLLHTLTSYDIWVWAVAVSADGRRAVSGGHDATVRVWDLEAGTVLHVLTGHDGEVWAAAVSADGRRAVSGGDDGTVRVWDLEAGTLLHTLTGHDGRVWAVAVSADGRRAVSGGHDGTVRMWDVVTGNPIASRRPKQARRRLQPIMESHDGGVWAVAVSADGRRAVSGGDDGTVRVWDLEAGTVLHALTGHDGGVWAVAVSADGRRAVSGGDDGTVRVWDLEAGTLLYTLTGHDGRVSAVAVSADGRRAVSGCHDRTVRVWDLTQGAELASFVSGNAITDLLRAFRTADL